MHQMPPRLLLSSSWTVRAGGLATQDAIVCTRKCLFLTCQIVYVSHMSDSSTDGAGAAFDLVSHPQWGLPACKEAKHARHVIHSREGML